MSFSLHHKWLTCSPNKIYYLSWKMLLMALKLGAEYVYVDVEL